MGIISPSMYFLVQDFMFPKWCFLLSHKSAGFAMVSRAWEPPPSSTCLGSQSTHPAAGGVLMTLAGSCLPRAVTSFRKFPWASIILHEGFGLPKSPVFACTLWHTFFTSPASLNILLTLEFILLHEANEELLLFPKARIYPASSPFFFFFFKPWRSIPSQPHPFGYSEVWLTQELVFSFCGGMLTGSHLRWYT